MMRRVPPAFESLRALDAARWRIAIGLTVAMTVIYVGFILLIAYAKPLLATPVVPGLSLGILLATCAAAIAVGAKIYENSILRMGARVKLREALSA